MPFDLKILFITDGLYPFTIGGMQKHASYLIKEFAGTEHQVHVVSAADNHSNAIDYAAKIFGNSQHDNISFELIPFPKFPAFPGHYVLASWMFSKKVFQLVGNSFHEYDLIYAKGFTSWYLLSKKESIQIPVCVQMHGLEMFQKPYAVKDKLIKFLLKIPAKKIIKKADFIFSYGGKIREILIQLGKPPQAIYEQYGAVDDFWLNPEPPIKDNGEPRKFLYVARYEFRKGYHILKPVIEKLIADNAAFTLDMVGQIPPDLHILDARIKYHGNLGADDLKVLKSQTEVLIVCSLAEGFPTILVEAMARNLSPIATDVGAVNAVVNADNGWLISPGNENSLLNAMKEAIALSPESLGMKQKKSRDLISRDFNWNSTFKMLVSQLQSIADDNRKRTNS